MKRYLREFYLKILLQKLSKILWDVNTYTMFENKGKKSDSAEFLTNFPLFMIEIFKNVLCFDYNDILRDMKWLKCSIPDTQLLRKTQYVIHYTKPFHKFRSAHRLLLGSKDKIGLSVITHRKWRVNDQLKNQKSNRIKTAQLTSKSNRKLHVQNTMHELFRK